MRLVHFRRLLLALVVTLLVAGAVALYFHDEPASWLEEVQLSSGEMVVIERVIGFDGRTWPAGTPIPVSARIRFPHPLGGRQVGEWEAWHARGQLPESPLLLDVEHGVPVIIAGSYYGTACPFYRRYVYRAQRWEETPMPAEIAPRATNLLLEQGENYVAIDAKLRQADHHYPRWLIRLDPQLKPCRTRITIGL